MSRLKRINIQVFFSYRWRGKERKSRRRTNENCLATEINLFDTTLSIINHTIYNWYDLDRRHWRTKHLPSLPLLKAPPTWLTNTANLTFRLAFVWYGNANGKKKENHLFFFFMNSAAHFFLFACLNWTHVMYFRIDFNLKVSSISHIEFDNLHSSKI